MPPSIGVDFRKGGQHPRSGRSLGACFGEDLTKTVFETVNRASYRRGPSSKGEVGGSRPERLPGTRAASRKQRKTTDGRFGAPPTRRGRGCSVVSGRRVH
jgi:hypothetical protein